MDLLLQKTEQRANELLQRNKELKRVLTSREKVIYGSGLGLQARTKG